MPRNRVNQPTTKNTGDLVIGLMQVNIGPAEDATTPTGAVSVGAVKESSVSMRPTFREHKSGYPQVLDFKIAEVLGAQVKVNVEEIGSTLVLDMLDTAIDSLETGTPAYYGVQAIAEFAQGGTLGLFAPYAQLKPNLSLNFGDDFSSMPFEFEALTNPAYTNKDLLYRTRTNAASRSTSNQPMTKNVKDLGIGMMQVRIGKPSRRVAGTASTTVGQKRKIGGSVTTDTALTSSGTYTGLVDGAIVMTCVDTDGPVFDVVMPDGTAVAGVDFGLGSTQLIGQGVSATFSSVAATAFALDDVYVIGAYTGSAIDNLTTGIISPYSFLTAADSIGVMQSASLETNPTYKEHFSGFPKVRDMMMLESSTVTLSTAIEEIAPAISALVKGYATSLYDMAFDSSVNGSLYNVPVEIVQELVTGGTLNFWMPNCQLAPEADFAPGNEWANFAIKFEAQIQNGIRRIYRQK